MKNITIKKPDLAEAQQAAELIGKESNMVNRPADFIASNNYLIAKDGKKAIGVIGAIDWENDTLEIVSHVVSEKYRGQKIGQKLFDALLEELETGSKRIFLCTTRVEYYAKLGFGQSSPDILTEKIRQNCANCPKGPSGPGFYPCPEVVMEHKKDQK